MNTKQIKIKHSIEDVVQEAALMGVEYVKNFDAKTAEGVIQCNPESLVLKVLERLDELKRSTH